MELLENKDLMDNLHKLYEKNIFENIWNNNKNNNWPNPPKYIREYMQFDIELRNEINDILNLNYYNLRNIQDYWDGKLDIDLMKDPKVQFMDLYKNNVIYTWNTNWYFSLDDTLKGFKELYELLELDNFNENALSLVYNKWIDKIDEMKKLQLSE